MQIGQSRSPRFSSPTEKMPSTAPGRASRVKDHGLCKPTGLKYFSSDCRQAGVGAAPVGVAAPPMH